MSDHPKGSPAWRDAKQSEYKVLLEHPENWRGAFHIRKSDLAGANGIALPDGWEINANGIAVRKGLK
jgi:hypothetical protein